jgi:hypothetical protein
MAGREGSHLEMDCNNSWSLVAGSLVRHEASVILAN